MLAKLIAFEKFGKIGIFVLMSQGVTDFQKNLLNLQPFGELGKGVEILMQNSCFPFMSSKGESS